VNNGLRHYTDEEIHAALGDSTFVVRGLWPEQAGAEPPAAPTPPRRNPPSPSPQPRQLAQPVFPVAQEPDVAAAGLEAFGEPRPRRDWPAPRRWPLVMLLTGTAIAACGTAVWMMPPSGPPGAPPRAAIRPAPASLMHTTTAAPVAAPVVAPPALTPAFYSTAGGEGRLPAADARLPDEPSEAAPIAEPPATGVASSEAAAPPAVAQETAGAPSVAVAAQDAAAPPVVVAAIAEPEAAARPTVAEEAAAPPVAVAVAPEAAAPPAAAAPEAAAPPAVAADAPTEAAPVAAIAAATAPGAVAAPDAPRRSDPVPAATLMRRAEAAFARGDIAAARAFFVRAAVVDPWSVEAMVGAGRTYDPGFLHPLGITGGLADAGEARRWYGRASQLGDPTAAVLAERLGDAR
jgi:hypothetical protein